MCLSGRAHQVQPSVTTESATTDLGQAKGLLLPSGHQEAQQAARPVSGLAASSGPSHPDEGWQAAAGGTGPQLVGTEHGHHGGQAVSPSSHTWSCHLAWQFRSRESTQER